MSDPCPTVEREAEASAVKRAMTFATMTLGEGKEETSLAAFSALGSFLASDDPDIDLIELRNTALIVVEGLGTHCRIGCEAFIATVRHQLLLSFGEPDDASGAPAREVERRYARLVAFAAELVETRVADRVSGR